MEEYKINDQYKDRLFCFLFGNEKYKKYALSLYNALNEVNYQNENELEIVTLKDIIYIRMHNDVSVMLSGNLELWEHQSTVNLNMPLRGLMYFAHLYEKYLVVNRFNRYQSTRIMIPTPKYVVFYNGKEMRPAVEEMRLSDAFMNEDHSGKYEWTATVLNLNHEDNKKLLRNCGMLREYTNFISMYFVWQVGEKNPLLLDFMNFSYDRIFSSLKQHTSPDWHGKTQYNIDHGK